LGVSPDPADKKGLARNGKKGSADPEGRNMLARVPLWMFLLALHTVNLGPVSVKYKNPY
jgi:hypothetical protein